jgi:N,N-dimethylformamidase
MRRSNPLFARWSPPVSMIKLASTGEWSGLCRRRGSPPQKLVGVGFTSEGTDGSKPYRCMPDKLPSWIFGGVEGQPFDRLFSNGTDAVGDAVGSYAEAV